MYLCLFLTCFEDHEFISILYCQLPPHPRRPRGSQSSREKRRDESFQAQAEEPLGTDSHRTISKRSSECWLLIGHKKCFVLLCPIGEQYLLSSFREFVHDATAIDSVTACLAHQTNARSQETFSLIKTLYFKILVVFTLGCKVRLRSC